MSKVPVLQSVRAAIDFRRHHWREVSGVLGAVALGATVNTAGDISGDGLLAMLGNAFYVPTAVMGYAALMRMAFIDEHPHDEDFHPGPQGFQWGRQEWRLIGVFLLLLFVYLIFAAMIAFVTMLVLIGAGLRNALQDVQTPEALMQALGPTGSGLFAAAMAAFAAVVLYVAIRVGLAPAATISRGKISVFETWPLTRHQFWRILAANILISLPTIAATFVLGVLVALLGQPGPDGPKQVAMPLALLLGAVPGLTMAFVQFPLSVGLTAYLFRGLRPPEESERARLLG